tara:strand:+ start:843 stop:2111 length:1269 start_codon:yes stop_codon:yes gene_type:complete
MQEDFLHYIWQYQKFSKSNLQTVKGESIHVLSVGNLNTNSGPDFFNSRVLIGDQEWFGTVEIHLKSSDWFVHSHQNDKAYQNVILHVVWEDDVIVYDNNKNKLETLVLKNRVNENLLLNYKRLLQNRKWINCENEIHTIDTFTMDFWKQKLLLGRLKRKVVDLNVKLLGLNNDWESLLYQLLAKSFGLKVNASEFDSLSQNISFEVFKKEFSNQFKMEALLLGHGNLLNESSNDVYSVRLQKEYFYLKQKHKLQKSFVNFQFFRLRPSSFPTIRLSQFSMLYYHQKNLFSKIISVKTVKDIYDVFSISCSEYWENHYVLGKVSVRKKKVLSKSFIDLIILNTIIPLKFAYAKSIDVDNVEEILSFYKAIKPEKNSTLSEFKSLKLKILNSIDSQSLIELKTQYCNKNKCLHCEIGNKLLYNS